MIQTKQKTINRIKPTTPKTITNKKPIQYFCILYNDHKNMVKSTIANTFNDYTVIDLECGHCIIQKL